MASIAQLFIEVGSKFDSKGLDATVNKIKTVEKNTENIRKGFIKTGAALTAFAVGGAAAIINLTNKASALEETSSKFSVVFADQIGIAEEWSRELVASYGVSTEEAKRYLGSIQDLLVPMGMISDDAAELSNKIVRLSVDLGSFNNMPTEKVMMDIQSALVGNFETMKKYGVVLNATRIEQHIMNQNLVESKDDITQAMKAQAAYELVVAGSQAALGDFNRTSEGYANQVKIMQARITDLAAKLGEKLIPTMKSLIGVVNSVTGFLQNLSPTVVSVIAKVLLFTTALAAILGPMALLIGFLPQIILGITQVTAVIKLSAAAINPWMVGIIAATVAVLAIVEAVDKWIDKTNKANATQAKENRTLKGRIKLLEEDKRKIISNWKQRKITEEQAILLLKKRNQTIKQLELELQRQQAIERAAAEATKESEGIKTEATAAEIKKRREYEDALFEHKRTIGEATLEDELDRIEEKLKIVEKGTTDEVALLNEKFRIAQEIKKEEEKLDNALFQHRKALGETTLKEEKDRLLEKLKAKDLSVLEEIKLEEQLLAVEREMNKERIQLVEGWTKATSDAIFDMITKGTADWESFASVLTTLVGSMATTMIRSIADIAAEWIAKHALMKAATLAWGAVEWAVTTAITAAKLVAQWVASVPIVGVVTGLAAAAALIATMNTWKGFKEGALVSGPTAAIFGEGGPEVALPLDHPKTTAALAGALEMAGAVTNNIGGVGDIIVNIPPIPSRAYARLMGDVAGKRIWERLSHNRKV